MGDFEVRGAADIDRLVKAINAHADSKALRRELYSGLNRASKDVRAEMKKAIPDALPRRGGLAAEVAKTTRFTTSAKSGSNAGITIWGRNKSHDVRTLTGRRLRHPVWGNRGVWVDQTAGLKAGAFLASFDKQKRPVQFAILRVMNDIAKKIAKG